MGVPAKYPPPAKYGDRVHFHRRAQPHMRIPELEGEGTFELAWLGIEECWVVRLDSGGEVSLFPYSGDTMEPVPAR